MLLGAHASTDRVSIINEADELLDAGTFNLANTTPLYKAALAWFSQIPRPTRLYIGKRNTGEAIDTALPACAAANNEWYGFVDVTHAVSDTLLAAAWAEANNRLYLTVIAEAGALTSATDDLATSLKTGNFFRTAWWYHNDLTQFPDVATAAKAFAAYPGGGGAAYQHPAVLLVRPVVRAAAGGRHGDTADRDTVQQREAEERQHVRAVPKSEPDPARHDRGRRVDRRYSRP